MTNLEFIELFRLLAMPLPRGDSCTWTDTEREHEEQRWKAYQSLIRTRHVSKRVGSLLSEFANSAPQHETHSEALVRINRYAPRWLTWLEAELERVRNATEREKFLNGQAEYDPFVAGANFTRDAFAGQVPPEPEIRPNER